MKLYKNNILLGILLILLLIFSLCILSKNTVIETNVNYGLEECIPQTQKIANINTDIGIIHTLENCIGEFKAISSNPSMCDTNYQIAEGNSDICSGGENNLGVYN